MNTQERCQGIELMIADVDGVLTDGGIIYDNEGIELKKFNARDGQGIKIWRTAGYQFGIITLRSSRIVQLRCADLNIELVRQGCEDKLPAARQMMGELGLDESQICYIGDDLPDLAVIKAVGLGVAVPDAAAEVREAADYITDAAGGNGAVRETIEMILKAKNRWNDLIRRFE
jgi:3-deoxy-D-manno-octulosonate 8-phosphate phosphatase (KDO 8-P phosphatase)